VERFNGRVQREVLGITIYSHRDLETLLKGFNQAYNRRRQRVLKGASPEQVVQRRLAAEPKLANRRYKPPDSDALPPALQVVAHAKEVSHPDTSEVSQHGFCRATVMHIGRMHKHVQDQSLRVDHQMALAAGDPLATIVAALTARLVVRAV
jgi:hypothetical protein